MSVGHYHVEFPATGRSTSREILLNVLCLSVIEGHHRGFFGPLELSSHKNIYIYIFVINIICTLLRTSGLYNGGTA